MTARRIRRPLSETHEDVIVINLNDTSYNLYCFTVLPSIACAKLVTLQSNPPLNSRRNKVQESFRRWFAFAPPRGRRPTARHGKRRSFPRTTHLRDCGDR